MIPKIIHYCWFGGSLLPEGVKAYIDSWKRHLPDFDIREWNEHNFDVNALAYTREAYYARKFAFVSDVARVHALRTVGGIYFDTDVLLKKPIPQEWLSHRFFAGFEHEQYVQTAVIASEAHHPLVEEFYRQYQTRHFISGVRYDLSTNAQRLTELMSETGFLMNNEYQEIEGTALYPQQLLCGKDWKTGRYDTEETIAVHDFQGTWGKEVLRHKYSHAAKMLATCLKWQLWAKKCFTVN